MKKLPTAVASIMAAKAAFRTHASRATWAKPDCKDGFNPPVGTVRSILRQFGDLGRIADVHANRVRKASGVDPGGAVARRFVRPQVPRHREFIRQLAHSASGCWSTSRRRYCPYSLLAIDFAWSRT